MNPVGKHFFMSTKTEKPNQKGSSGIPERQRKSRGSLLVHAKLRNEILWMKLAPGTALDEIALATRFEVSRTPIREALLLLAEEGYVRFLQNRTSIVSPLSMENLRALYDTRLVLSRSVMRSAATNLPANPKPLQKLYRDFKKHLLVSNDQAAFKGHLSLNQRISELTCNRFLEKYFLEVEDASVRTKLLFFFPNLSSSDRKSYAMRIEDVLSQVVAGNAEASDIAIREALQFEITILQKGLGPTFGHHLELGPEMELVI